MRLLESGFVERWKSEFFPSLQCDAGIKVEARVTSIRDVYGTFLLLAFGLIAASFTLGMENILANTKID